MRTKRFLSIVLTLAMLLGMLPDMSLTAYAEGSTTEITSTNTSGTMTITLTIKAAQTITASDVTATYGDTDKSVSASVTEPTTGGGAITYAVKDGSGDYIDVASDGKLTIKKVPASGEAYVIVKAAATDDYVETTKEVTVTISKAEATVTAKDQSIMVGSTVPDLSAPVLNTHYSVTGLVGADALTTAPTLVYQKNGRAATPYSATAGTYDIVPSGASAGDNYNISYTNGTLTISEKQPATVTKAPEAKTLTYNVSAQELVTAGTATGGTMQYALGDANGATQPYTTSIPTVTDAGTYYVWYKVVGDENHTDSEPVCVTVVIAEKQVDPMPLNVEIHNYTNTGANGVPGDVPRTEFKVTIQLIDKESGEVVSTAADVAFEVMGGPNSAKVSLENVEFDQKLSDLSEAKYQVVVTGFPAKVTGVAPISQEYALSYTAWPGGSKLITIYLKWDDGKRSEPEIIRIYALPEDEIGAYTIREDGTKEYLIFHTYDICMRWLGSDELCRGYERCFHKENAYVNPFVTNGELIEEIVN